MATHATIAQINRRLSQVCLSPAGSFAYDPHPLLHAVPTVFAGEISSLPDSPTPVLAVDFQIQRCARRCSVTEKEFQPGEIFYSVLLADGAEIIRQDFSKDAWEGAPEDSLGWWKSCMPAATGKKIGWAPNDVMLEFFHELADKPEKEDLRYVLTLLLIRRRVMRLEETESQADQREELVVYCSRQEETYRVPVVHPGPARSREIQDELANLLLANTE